MTAQTLELRLSDKDLLTGNMHYLAKIIAGPLVADYAGLFGAVGTIDSPLTAIATLGAMAGYFGRYRDSAMLAGLTYGAEKFVEFSADFLKDGKLNEANLSLEKNLATYGLSILAGLGTRYLIDQWNTKTKPALTWLGRKLHILPKKTSHQPVVVTDTQGVPLRDLSGAKIVVEGSDPNIQNI